MHRLDRRLVLLRAKRNGTFDPNQYWLEQARRARIARRLRSRIRRMLPVILLTPRWSSPRRFLDDVATDLQIGAPEVRCRTLDCAGLKGLSHHQAWAWFADGLAEFAGLRIDGPAWQVVSRLGFQQVIHRALDAIQLGTERRCLMLHGLEHVPIDALDDLIQAFETYQDAVEGEPRFTLVLAGSIPPDELQITGAGRPVILADYTEAEAVEALVEEMGPLPAHRLESVVELVGGVPQVLETLAAQGEQVLSTLVAEPEALWRLLGPLATEIRGAYDILASDEELSRRLDRLASEGPLDEDPTVDPQLVLAGMASRGTWRQGRQVLVRSRAFAHLAAGAA